MNRAWLFITSVFLATLLVVLTIGLPLTYSSMLKLKEVSTSGKVADKGPYSNSTEEKVPVQTVNEEYVHSSDSELSVALLQLSASYIHVHEAIYVAFHGEMLCPPPNYLAGLV